ncbi:kinase D-interacting substrate of 220 kDa-like [Haliotis rubra]|uniref:kinase D-interacting substrate of 220 kDa-like n=1 Tax=Haliotis rubra TaxID=36100 RepID=UPI001EE5F4FA|nr:kinase D-interacting substrate of 220 kDa-like [Haliotis rubra]
MLVPKLTPLVRPLVDQSQRCFYTAHGRRKTRKSPSSTLDSSDRDVNDRPEYRVHDMADATSTPQQDPGSDANIEEACLHGNLERVRYLLSQCKEDIARKNTVGRTPLMTAAFGRHREVFDFLLREGADISIGDDNGCNILHWACRGGSIEMVKYILSMEGMGVNDKGTDGTTPVVSAAWRGHKDVVEFLVSLGADMSVVDDLGETILHWAAQGGNVEMVKYILSQNIVDVDTRSKMGQTAADIAQVWDHKDVVKLLRKPRCHVM